MADVRDQGAQAPAAGVRSLSPDDIAGQSFTSAFRGYDPAHVRTFLAQVSERVAVLEARNTELEREIERLREEAKQAKEQLARPAPSPESVAAASEFSGLLQAARERALEIEAAAAEQAERLIAEARARADEIRGEAEAELAEANARADRLAAERVAGADEMVERLRAEADALAVKIKEDAEREAANRVVDAREEADRIIEAAKEQGREVVREAQAVITKRKRAAEAQLDQLRDARDRLLSNLQAARRAVDEVITGVESGRPAEAAGRDAGPLPAGEAAGRGESAGEPTPPGGVDRVVVTPPKGLTAVSPPKRNPEVVGSRDPAPAAPAEGEAPQPSEPEEERVEERRSSALRILRRGKPEARKAVHAEPVHTLGEPVEGVRIIGPKGGEEAAEEPAAETPTEEPPAEEPEPVQEEVVAEAAAVESASEPETLPEPEPEVVAAATTEEPPAEPEPSPPRKVDELFARIRADREAAVAKAEEVLAQGSPEAEAATDPTVDEAPVVGAEAGFGESSDEDEALLQRRDSAVESAEAQLTRRLKRALQDEQNELLDALRNVRGQLSVDALLGDATAHRDRYAALAKSFLSTVGGEAIGALPAELASDLVDALRHRLSRVLAECMSDGADAIVIADRASAIYREWKTQRAASTASHYVVAAHAAASYAEMPDGAEGIWVVDDGGVPCPDCDDNALAGPTARGERYPTGQLHPPAHAGCRCVIRVLKAALTT